ncbi:helix-turn-helix transcriptional regulator [Nocardiopsis sp. CNT-189]|uniref:helix-turn-helix domain-containing protein n=1 Tax=Nocardiopsis oceanisediminis TaxID=2816862 RepID=UPI003B2B1855
MPVPHPLIAELARARRDAGMSLKEMAYRLGYAPGSLSKWEAGDTTPNVDAATDYAAALGYRLTLTREGGAR